MRRADRAHRVYDLLLRCYPRRFRARFAADMRDTFARDHTRAAGERRLTAFWIRTLVEAVAFGASERVAPAPVVPVTSNGAPMSSKLLVDLRDAWRALRATPVVTAVAVLSLALGIGANTALFSILNGLVLKSLPVDHPEQLVVLRDGSWTNPIWEQIRDRQSQIAAGAFAWSDESFDLSQRGETDRVSGAFVSGGMFQLLGVSAERGRLLAPADDVRGGAATGGVAVVSDAFWRQRLGGAADAIGRTITLDRVPFTVVGVMPRTFSGPDIGRRYDVIVPLGNEPLLRGAETVLDARSTWWLEIMFRLRPGQTIDEAAAALNAIRPSIRQATQPQDFGPAMLARYLDGPFQLAAAANGQTGMQAEFKDPLVIMLVVVGAVLLIACANIANLLLARATARRRDLSVRLALGASHARIARQLFCESLVLASAGTFLGLAMAKAGSAVLTDQLGIYLDTSLDWRVLAFTSGVGLVTALVFGIAPAWGASRLSAFEALKDQGRSIAGDRRLGVRNALVVVQVALSLMLVVGAGLFIRTFQAVSAAPLGLDVDPLLMVRLDIRRTPIEGPGRHQLLARFLEVAASTPGVRSAAISRIEPLTGAGWNTQIVNLQDGAAGTPGVRFPWVNGVTPGWFHTYGMRLVSGRDFTAADRVGGPRVAVVNQAFVRRFFAGQNPMGRRISMGGPGRTVDYEVVGVVSDSAYRRPREGSQSIVYVPYFQLERLSPNPVMAVELATGGRGETVRRLSLALAAADPGVAFVTQSFADSVRGTMKQERLIAGLSGSFGALALLMAAIGLYGVTAYGVSRRRAEIGVRMALGAEPSRVVRLVLARVGWLVGVGLCLGVGLSLWAAKFIGPALLFGLQPRDPSTFLLAVAVLIAVALVTAWIPARRASRIDPTEVLRQG